MSTSNELPVPATECVCRKALEYIVALADGFPATESCDGIDDARAALATPCECAELREELELKWGEIDGYKNDFAMFMEERRQLRAELAEAVAALRRIAKIDFPSMSSDGAWVAKTLFCNDMITAFQVREARAIVARFDAQRGKA